MLLLCILQLLRDHILIVSCIIPSMRAPTTSHSVLGLVHDLLTYTNSEDEDASFKRWIRCASSRDGCRVYPGPTDAAIVIEIFKGVKVPRVLSTLTESEAAFNDATGLVERLPFHL